MTKLNKRKDDLRLIIYVFLLSSQILTEFVLSYMVPILANYPPFSEETVFVKSLEPLTHWQQYLLFGLLYMIITLIFIKISFKDIFIFLKEHSSQRKLDFKFISKVRLQCLKLPSKFLMLQISVVLALVFIAGTAMGVHFGSFLKIIIIYMSIFTFITVITITILRTILGRIIVLTYNTNPSYENSLYKKTSFSKNISLQLIPFLIAILGVITMITYGEIVNAIGESNYQYYKTTLIGINEDTLEFNDISKIEKLLKSIPLKSHDDTYFIISPNRIITSNNKDLTPFFIEYTKVYSEKLQGKTYEFWGEDTQGYSIALNDPYGNSWYIGFRYSATNASIINALFVVNWIIISVYILLIIIWSNGISSNIKSLYVKMDDIVHKNNLDSADVMPITSTDEIGQLSYALNQIQDLTKSNIEQIHSNQDIIIEKERLASLGQMIGGIAHNLKTPIMSISGAAEGISDLIKEYSNSIGDLEVTVQDHHEIAKDMSDWIEKVRTHLSYMSDVITAIKGQAVTFADVAYEQFTVNELVKHINILMKHELSNALIELKTNIDISLDTEVSGNVNSLVQVVNNIISNAIQAYNGKQNQVINLSLYNGKYKKEDVLIIKIEDYAGGLPDKVKEKLFKEMITTKGKNGTGLGLFMSYSNIKAHFNGHMWCETESGVGTAFYIEIPIK